MPARNEPMAGLLSISVLIMMVVLGLAMSAPPVAAQNADRPDTVNPLRPADTSSPRATLRSFLDRTDEMMAHLSEGVASLAGYRSLRGALETFDLGTAAYGASWLELLERVGLLKEILDRVELPPDDQIPGADEAAEGAITKWTIPGTRITIARQEIGPQAGEFLFSADSLARLEFFYRQARHLPYQPGAKPGLYAVVIDAARSGEARGTEVQDRLKGADTSSPRATFEGFLKHMNRAYQLVMRADAALSASPPTMTIEQARALERSASDQLARATDTLDLSQVPEAQRADVAVEAALQLKEVFDRITLPPIESIPDADGVAPRRVQGDTLPLRWRLPNTQIEIVEITEGDFAGEFLFSSASVERIAQSYQRMADLPYQSETRNINAIEYVSPDVSEGFYEYYISSPGYLIAYTTFLGQLVENLPASLKVTHAGQTVWQWIGLLLCVLAILVIGYLTFRTLGLLADRIGSSLGHWVMILPPLIVAFIVGVVFDFVDHDLNITGDVLAGLIVISRVAVLLLLGWAVWAGFKAIAETIIAFRGIKEGGIDASMTRIMARLLGIVVGVWIVLAGLQGLGAEIVPLLAGLGVGGLAVALAVRPTLENLIGGLILYADKPVRVGDFCSFGDRMGTVESIGVRSTRIRALDRTVISVPNAMFADMEIINWARCDQMLIQSTIGLRYETDPDQLRYVLAKMREMFHAHPKIDRETVRVRFSGYGPSSLDITIRVYALTRDWNDYHAIREDIYLRISDIVRDSGTGFAFPSQTVYMRRDDGLDQERSDAAVQEVKAWRRSSKLPFPRLAPSKMHQLEGTLDYPPRGSVEIGSPALHAVETTEPLSTEPLSTEPLSTEPLSTEPLSTEPLSTEEPEPRDAGKEKPQPRVVRR